MIAIGCDHAGYDMKTGIIKFLEDKGIEVIDCGCDGSPCDYPVIAKKVCENITCGKADKGILICGTGIGMSIAANKIKGIRASVCSEHFSVKYTRLHNDANVLCMGERTIGPGLACDIADIFLNTEFEGGRHKTRVDMFMAFENE